MQYTLQVMCNGESFLKNDNNVKITLNGEPINSKAISVLQEQYHIYFDLKNYYQDGMTHFEYTTPMPDTERRK